MRLCCLAATLAFAAAWAQSSDLGSCVDRCSGAMTDCAARCGADPKCSSRCMKRYETCATRCQESSKVGKANKGPKPKQCMGPAGKAVPCSEITADRTPKRPSDKDDEQFPNKSAKDLAKDPNFSSVPKGAE
jgi:hypothetical protein